MSIGGKDVGGKDVLGISFGRKGVGGKDFGNEINGSKTWRLR